MTTTITCLLIVLVTAFSFEEPAQPLRPPIIQTVVIDPGHGGANYPGAEGLPGFYEKHLTLELSRKLKRLILEDADLQASGVRVLMTRERDVAIALPDRAAYANSVKGDLFISIHANGSSARSATGAETFFLSMEASDVHAAKVAEFENQEITRQEGQSAENDELKLILFDVIHKKYIEESKFLAELIQAEFNRTLNLRNRGIKQAPFQVLKGVAMPGVLVEVDFISNPQRARLLRSDAYQTRIAQSLLQAIKKYKILKERGYSYSAARSTGQSNTK